MINREAARLPAGRRPILKVALALGLLLATSLAAAPRATAVDQPHAYSEEVVLSVVRDGREYQVLVQMLLMRVPGRDAEADRQAARAEAIASFPGATSEVTGEGVHFAHYVRNTYRWPGRETTVGYNRSARPAGLTGDEEALAGAMAGWNSAGSAFTFRGPTPSNAGTGGCRNAPDGTNVVGWANLAGGTLARTCTWYDTAGNANEFDVELGLGFHWTTGTPIDVDMQSVVAHELGHALGLGHSPDPNALMYDTYMTTTEKRLPQPDDIAGLLAIYGKPASAVAAALPPTSVHVFSGANLVTWPGPDRSAAEVLGSQGGLIGSVYALDGAGNWVRFIPGGPTYANSLTMLVGGQAYWFVAHSEGTLRFQP